MHYDAPTQAEGAEHQWLGRSHVKGDRNWIRWMLVTCNLLGMQLVWSTEMGMAAPYLLSLGVSKSSLAAILLAGPISGLVVQPIVGAMSDTCTLSLGRRRPFILIGCAICACSLIIFGWARQVAGLFAADGGAVHRTLTIWLAALSVWVIDFSVNAVQAADRALLVDVLPASEQADVNAWAGRLTGIGAIAGFGIADLDLPRWFSWFGSTQIQILAILISALFVASHLVTCWAVTERVLLRTGPVTSRANPIRIFRELWHAYKKLPELIWRIYLIQCSLWVGWFGVMFYSTTWVSEMYLEGRSLDLVDARTVDRAERAGSYAMLCHAIINFVTTVFAPMIINHQSVHAKRRSFIVSRDETLLGRIAEAWRPIVDRLRPLMPKLPIEWLTLSQAWFFANVLFCILMFASYFVFNATGATVIIAMTGFCWAFTAWVPFTLLGELILQTGKPVLDGVVGSDEDLTADSFALVASDDHSDDDERDDEEYRTDNRNGDALQVLELHHADSMEETESARPMLAADIELGASTKDDAPVADSAGTIIGLHNVFVVLPQLVVSFCSTFIFAHLSPQEPLPGANEMPPGLLLFPRQEVLRKWDSIGLIFRLGGAAAAYSSWLSWKMVREEREAKRRRSSRHTT